MSDLRRFQVSDEFSVSWKTLDFDSNRMNFFETHFLENENFLGKAWKCREWPCASTGSALGCLRGLLPVEILS